MKLGIMQPYFFPYLGYFDLINRVDRWIVFDTPQYIRHGWVNRNRILHPKTGWQHIVVPLKKQARETGIKDVVIADDASWKNRILGQLSHYRKKAPYFEQTMEFVRDCLELDESHLSRLNTKLLENVCKLLSIPFDYQVFSEMDLSIGQVSGPGDWALRICESLKANEYFNLPGGKELFDSAAFAKIGAKLTIPKFQNIEYQCRGYEFIPALSIIDILMWVPPEAIHVHLAAQRNERTSSEVGN